MCTVTFVPVKDKIFITSSRDENILRRNAIPPQLYTFDGGELIYPRDAAAGGSWIVMKNNSDAAVLLNGAFFKHIHQPPYASSRGLVFLDIVKAGNPVEYFLSTSLYNIEPFTLVLWGSNQLYECRWDGHRRFQKKLDAGRPHIWSSVTLYTEDIIMKREMWFAKWVSENNHPQMEDVLRFHRFGGEGDRYNNFCMNRNNMMLTVSITGMQLEADKGSMTYMDIKADEQYYSQFEFASEACCNE